MRQLRELLLRSDTRAEEVIGQLCSLYLDREEVSILRELASAIKEFDYDLALQRLGQIPQETR
ncbi:hypothetical protein H681_11960 [Pseudomonas sp. ATCC 13867]|uniref:hypothetical protein n=1 Tax=Pseudomonas sp. ATCC 13867 TaxID=1294143 RepID=UPI0002C4F098|nr:hypothetical protein [Pseudomonas sp. ATCC 13867]AGI24262.1 hypothetical protein H681_11960 [Pseudomonas sp. ATCC 13867]RFQ16498.1 hypothetical protein D0N87_26655 [Pseudomonas sp. ATCC 13867]